MENYNTTAQGHEMGWDDEIQQESSFILLPEGDYRFTVEKFDRARHNGSDKIPPCNKAILHFRVFSPDGSSVLLQENLFLHTAVGIFRQHRHEAKGTGCTDELAGSQRKKRHLSRENPQL